MWAFKESLEQVGAEELATYDEVLMLNSTCFGPVGSFDDVFAEMDARDDIDFWGITDHGPMRRHPVKKDRPLAHHIQTHWLAARQRLVTSPDWAEYWSTMPMIETYHGSIDHHETRFTPYFVERGYTSATSFPATNYGSPHPIMDNPVAMVRDGCPLVKRRSFFYDPLYNEWKATDGRQLARMMEERGYPMDQVYRNLARTSKPRLLATNMGWMDVLPEVDLGYDHDHPLRIVGIAHIFYPEMTDEIVDRFDHLPHDYDLVVTTTDEEKKAVIAAALARRGRAADIRIVKSNRGRDISAFFIDCKDVLESGDYDIVVKLHSKKQPQDNPNIQELFKRHMFDNLLSSPGYAANVLRLFQQQPTLGMVFPPVYHIAYPTLGHAWFANKERAEQEAEQARDHRPPGRQHPALGVRQLLHRPTRGPADDHLGTATATRTSRTSPTGRARARRSHSRLRMQQQRVTANALLPLGVDAVGVAHPAAHEVLEPRVAVEAGAVLADLREPRPHLVGRRGDRDGARVLHGGVGHDLVARHRPVALRLARAPSPDPRDRRDVCAGGPQHQRVGRARGRRPAPSARATPAAATAVATANARDRRAPRRRCAPRSKAGSAASARSSARESSRFSRPMAS